MMLTNEKEWKHVSIITFLEDDYSPSQKAHTNEASKQEDESCTTFDLEAWTSHP